VEEKKMRINTILERKKCPIIIVPEHYQLGNVSLANIEKFLVNGDYIENPPPMHDHQRKIEMEFTLRGRRVLFDVTNNPSLLTPTDWNNVVAIFVQGRKNEFQNWFYRDPVEVFKRAKGFLLKFPTKEQTEGH
jgi:parafibromin